MPNWKKVIVSGSDAALNSLNISSGLTATGSVNISGSTTQIGNNALIGNTSLSGSLTISGSSALTPNDPTIKIFGDVETNGVIKFLPVIKNIDTSVSASYIFVSGSTNDLYFSQNGAGYTNTTRLRWLEGNLYTGLLNGGIITSQSSTVYQVSSGSGIIVNLNASFDDNPYPTIQYLNWPNLSASIAPLTASYQQAFVGIDSTNNIFQQGTPFNNGQFDTLINIGLVLFQNGSTINGVKTQPSVAYGFEQQQNIFNRAFGPLKLSGYTLSPSGSSTGSLVVASGTAYSLGSNYTIDPNEPSYTIDSGTNVSKIFRYRQSGSTWVYDTNGGVGYTTIDPSQYSNNGVLTPVPTGVFQNRWSIQRVFYFPNSVAKAIVVYYGNAVYASQTDATANIPYEPFVEAPNTAANAIYLGAIVARYDADFTDNATFNIQPGGLFRQVGGSGGGGSVVTQTLTGLSDVAISGPTNLQPFVYSTTAAKWINSSNISASLFGNAQTATSASHALNSDTAISASHALNADNAISASFASTALSSSFASTASYVTPLNQDVLITGSLTIGSGSIGSGENTLVIGPSPAGGAGEGGQILLSAKGDSGYTSASMLDTYQNRFRILRGTNAASDAEPFTLNLHTGQITVNQYTSLNSFPATGMSTKAFLGIDSGGNVITTNSISGSLGVGTTGSAVLGRIDAANDVVAFSTSDENLKKNIKPIKNAIEKIEQIGGYTFDWKKDKKNIHGFSGHDVGVIAQEIEAVLPEVVVTRENGYKAVRYEKIIPLLIEAIKEQQNKINELENLLKQTK